MSEYLAHHGILGQKWGIRRYQNKDGSLTPAGQKRYNKLQGELDKLGGKSNQPVKKKLSEMSDEELLLANNRLRMESDYQRMYSQLHPVKESMWKKIGTKITQEALPNAVSQSVQDVVGNTLKKWGNYATDKIYEEKTGQKPLNDLKKQVELLKTKKERKNLEDELSGIKSEKQIQQEAMEESKYLTALNNIHKQKEEMRKWADASSDSGEKSSDKSSDKGKSESKPQKSEKKESGSQTSSKTESSSVTTSSTGSSSKSEPSYSRNSYLDSFLGAREASHALTSGYNDIKDSGLIDSGQEFVSFFVTQNGGIQIHQLNPLDQKITHMDNTEYLVHHGIKGQKWGVRRFQNEDGSLTEAGRAKLGRYQKRALKQAERRYKRERKNALDDQKKNNETVAKDVLEDIKARKGKEIEAIKNMKLSDIKEERAEATKAVAKQLGLSLGAIGAGVGAEAAALSLGYIVISPIPVMAAVTGLAGVLTSPAAGSQAKIDKRLKRAGYE